MSASCIEQFRPYVERGDAKTTYGDLDAKFPGFVCELEKCSELSPKIICDDEAIGYLLIDLQHYDPETGTVTQKAIEGLYISDLSVIRKFIADKAQIDATKNLIIESGKGKHPPQDREVDHVSIMNVGEVRNALIDDTRIFGLYDTSLEGQTCHASLYMQANDKKAKSLRKMQIRSRILEILNKNVVKYQDFRDS